MKTLQTRTEHEGASAERASCGVWSLRVLEVEESHVREAEGLKVAAREEGAAREGLDALLRVGHLERLRV